MHRKNMTKKPAKQTLQKAHSTYCVKVQHELSITKFSLQSTFYAWKRKKKKKKRKHVDTPTWEMLK